MSLTQLAEIGSLISGVSIMTSVIFLYFQLRQINHQVKQAQKNQQSAIRQERARRTVGIVLTGTEPSLADAFVKGASGDEDISLTQLGQFEAVCRAIFVNSEGTFYEHEEGLLDKTSFAAFVSGMKGSFGNPGFRAQWKSLRGNYGIRFVAFMDKLLIETPVTRRFDILEQWGDAIAAEKAAASRSSSA
jgi:hypothetical protein